MSPSTPSFQPGWGSSKSLKNDELQAALDLGPGYDDGQGGEMLREMYSAYRGDVQAEAKKKKSIASARIERSLQASRQMRAILLGIFIIAIAVFGFYF